MKDCVQKSSDPVVAINWIIHEIESEMVDDRQKTRLDLKPVILQRDAIFGRKVFRERSIKTIGDDFLEDFARRRRRETLAGLDQWAFSSAHRFRD
jgi:hypothetical protein